MEASSIAPYPAHAPAIELLEDRQAVQTRNRSTDVVVQPGRLRNYPSVIEAIRDCRIFSGNDWGLPTTLGSICTPPQLIGSIVVRLVGRRFRVVLAQQATWRLR